VVKKTRSSGLPFQISTSHSIQKNADLLKWLATFFNIQSFSIFVPFVSLVSFGALKFKFSVVFIHNKKKVLTQKQQKNAQKML